MSAVLGARRVDRGPLTVAGRWLLLLVALGGLLAMHGLSDHGSAGPTAVAATGSPAAPAAAPMTGPEGVAPHAEHGDPGSGTTGGHQDHHGGSLVGLCLAVLGAVLLLGLAARRAGLVLRLRDALAEHRSVAAAMALRARARGPAPPDLRVLSIQRC